MDCPVPRPRRSTQMKSNTEETSKKPVPLPRQNQINKSMVETNPASVFDNDDLRKSSKFSERPGGKHSTSKLIKDEIKAATEIVQEKGRAAFGNTRNASLRLERSFRSLGKRLTVHSVSKTSEVLVNEPKIERSQSLPSENIFQSISFKSPLVADDSSETLVNIIDVYEDDFDSFSAPPPVYPPPPLPDESVYDEVQSVISHSSIADEDCLRYSSAGSYADNSSVYEEVTFHNKRSSKSQRNNETDRSPNKSSVTDTLHSSDSSKYIESLFEAEGRLSRGKSDIVPNFFDDANSVNISASRNSVSNSSISPSLLSELDLSEYNTSPDDTFEDDRYSCSVQSAVSSSCSVQNELYDKWEFDSVSKIPEVFLRKREVRRPGISSKSVIYEFDPLFGDPDNNEGKVETDLTTLMLCNENKNLDESHYGKITKMLCSTVNENCSEQPPVPPRRTDSITLGTSGSNTSIEVYDGDCNKRENCDATAASIKFQTAQEVSENVPSTYNDAFSQDVSADIIVKPKKPLVRWASMKNAMRFVSDSRSPTIPRRNKQSMKVKKQPDIVPNEGQSLLNIAPPVINPSVSRLYNGSLFKVSSRRPNDYVERWCSLAEGKLTAYVDRVTAIPKETILLCNIMSVHVALDHKISSEGDCFEITLNKGQTFVFGTTSLAERRVWMQKILESITIMFPVRVTTEYARAGWCFLKEGINGTWYPAWILMYERNLLYCVMNGKLQETDLRKARYIVLQEVEEDTEVPHVLENGPLVLADFHSGLALYLRINIPSEAVAWQKAIYDASVNNGLSLSEQQLTRDDVPVIVDKCIKFIYAHGSLSEGIYRRAGTNSSVTRLLTLFRKDAWKVQLSRPDYSEYEVATVLKRFFRELPECLLTTELHNQLCDIAAGIHQSDRMNKYKRALERLPPINYVTARKLIGHLYFIHEQHEKNRMPVDNLAALWGPTLMHVEAEESLNASQCEASVVADLIRYYPHLFDVAEEELGREKRMLEVLERYHHSNSSMPPKQTGEFKVWVHLESRDSGKCISVTVGPQKTAGNICSELADTINWPSHELILEEVICCGDLTRPLHYTEKVLDTVLRWGYWDDIDRKDNCLVLCKNSILEEIVPLAKPPLAMCGELRYADQRSKTFKNFLFEFSQAKLCHYKDKDGSIKLNEWRIEDIVWYVGHESKRNPHTRWAITFIDKNGKKRRSKENPFFGCTIAGSSREEQLRWMAAMLIGEYPQGLLPSPVLLE